MGNEFDSIEDLTYQYGQLAGLSFKYASEVGKLKLDYHRSYFLRKSKRALIIRDFEGSKADGERHAEVEVTHLLKSEKENEGLSQMASLILAQTNRVMDAMQMKISVLKRETV